MIAVDPTVIPLGTRVFVPGYGPAVAADVGSAVKGNIIDLWMPSTAQARGLGTAYRHDHHLRLDRATRILLELRGLRRRARHARARRRRPPAASCATRLDATDAALAGRSPLGADGGDRDRPAHAERSLFAHNAHAARASRRRTRSSRSPGRRSRGSVPRYRFRTELFGVGTRSGATWNGDLVLKGFGDPTLDDARPRAARRDRARPRDHARDGPRPRRRVVLRHARAALRAGSAASSASSRRRSRRSSSTARLRLARALAAPPRRAGAHRPSSARRGVAVAGRPGLGHRAADGDAARRRPLGAHSARSSAS